MADCTLWMTSMMSNNMVGTRKLLKINTSVLAACGGPLSIQLPHAKNEVLLFSRRSSTVKIASQQRKLNALSNGMPKAAAKR